MIIKGNRDTNELFIDGVKVDLNESLSLRNHSPAGFNWGYSGSGPSQTALAILLKVGSQADALKWYHTFKNEFVCKWNRDDIELELEVKIWLDKKKGLLV